jgi:ankyrin repeat protein
MAHGADVNAKDKAGKTPLMWAAGPGQQAVVDWLKQHGAVE